MRKFENCIDRKIISFVNQTLKSSENIISYIIMYHCIVSHEFMQHTAKWKFEGNLYQINKFFSYTIITVIYT